MVGLIIIICLTVLQLLLSFITAKESSDKSTKPETQVRQIFCTRRKRKITSKFWAYLCAAAIVVFSVWQFTDGQNETRLAELKQDNDNRERDSIMQATIIFNKNETIKALAEYNLRYDSVTQKIVSTTLTPIDQRISGFFMDFAHPVNPVTIDLTYELHLGINETSFKKLETEGILRKSEWSSDEIVKLDTGVVKILLGGEWFELSLEKRLNKRTESPRSYLTDYGYITEDLGKNCTISARIRRDKDSLIINVQKHFDSLAFRNLDYSGISNIEKLKGWFFRYEFYNHVNINLRGITVLIYTGVGKSSKRLIELYKLQKKNSVDPHHFFQYYYQKIEKNNIDSQYEGP